MQQSETRIEDFLAEVGFGEVRIQVLDKKVILVPKQRIQRPKRLQGVRVEVIIDEPFHLKL